MRHPITTIDGLLGRSVLAESGCLEWQGARNTRGYGVLRVYGKMIGAHRYMMTLKHGAISRETQVCHTCDNPSCINPDHLFLGTPADNSHDRDAKGRHVPHKGASNWFAKLTDSQAAEIKVLLGTSAATPLEIAEMYGVSRDAIYKIASGKNWRHI